MIKTAFACLLLAPIPALAAQGDFAACVGIADPGQRLACFDAAAKGLAFVPPPPRDPVAEFGRPAAPPPAAPRDPVVDFGRPPAAPPDTAALEEINSSVAGSSTGQDGRLIVKLANGQAWSVRGWNRPLPPREETPVTVSRGFFGDNYLINLPSGAYGAVRLR